MGMALQALIMAISDISAFPYWETPKDRKVTYHHFRLGFYSSIFLGVAIVSTQTCYFKVYVNLWGG